MARTTSTEPRSGWRTVPLDRGDVGVRVDRVLLRHLQDGRSVSRTRIQKWIDAGDVLINGASAPRAAWRIAAGDDVRVRLASRRERLRPAAEAIPLDILFEDDHFLAVNKPAGLVVHPSHLNSSGTLLNGVLAHAQGWPAGSKPSLLGRLDKHTSGVVLIAKRPAVLAAMQRAMAALRIDKDYLAIVWGKPTPARGIIDLALDRDPWDRRRITVTDRGGQPSATRYERLAMSLRERTDDQAASASVFSLVRCRLITGRTHQIRVHLSAKQWPIVGDAVYGRSARTLGTDTGTMAARQFPRQALHAWRVTLPHPIGGAVLSIVAPVPDDLQSLCAAVGLPLQPSHL